VIESALMQAAFKLCMAIVAIVAMNYTLRFLNHATGNKFDETLADASADMRLGYFGARLIGYAFIVGSVIS
tara:strand:+ start:500 stop:712 length:213 start_codon:yes stop_codon:yes gene_type:complete